MRYLVVSDTHGSLIGFREALADAGKIDGVLHLGDICGQQAEIEGMIDCPLVVVKGNNDFDYSLPSEHIFILGKHRIFMCHGHAHMVSISMNRARNRAREEKCDCLLFGHTHAPFLMEQDGILVANPGSLTYPRTVERKVSYMIMNIDPEGPVSFDLRYLD